MQTFKLDPKKFPGIRRNIIITYAVMSLAGLGVVYLYLGDALFGRAWGLIPFVFVVFALVGWFALRERKQYWDEFRLEIGSDALNRSAYKTSTVSVRKSAVTGVREVRQGMIVSTKSKENLLLIPRQLEDEDYQAVKRLLGTWTNKKD